MDQDQSTDRSGEYLVYGNAADATTFASGMSALGFRSSVQGQVNLGLVASHNPDIIKAYGGMMGGISRPGHGGGVRPDSALRYSPFARSLVAASCQPRNSSCGVRRSHRHRSNGFDQCADPRLLQRFSSMDAMVSLVSIHRHGNRTCITVLSGTPHPPCYCPTTLRTSKGRQGNNQVVAARGLSRLFHLRTAVPRTGSVGNDDRSRDDPRPPQDYCQAMTSRQR